MDDESFIGVAVVAFLIVLAVLCIAMFTWGSTTSTNRHNKLLSKAGIEKLVQHEIIVDGTVATNWVEIIWNKK